MHQISDSRKLILESGGGGAEAGTALGRALSIISLPVTPKIFSLYLAVYSLIGIAVWPVPYVLYDTVSGCETCMLYRNSYVLLSMSDHRCRVCVKSVVIDVSRSRVHFKIQPISICSHFAAAASATAGTATPCTVLSVASPSTV